MVHLVVTDPTRLELVDAEIHDWFYDIDDVALEASGQQLVVPFRRWDFGQAKVIDRRLLYRVEELPWYRWNLRISFTLSHDLHDEARIGGADFNRVRYDGGTGTLKVEGNLPVTIHVQIERLRVEVEETEQLLGFGYRTFGRLGWETHSGQVLAGIGRPA